MFREDIAGDGKAVPDLRAAGRDDLCVDDGALVEGRGIAGVGPADDIVSIGQLRELGIRIVPGPGDLDHAAARAAVRAEPLHHDPVRERDLRDPCHDQPVAAKGADKPLGLAD